MPGVGWLLWLTVRLLGPPARWFARRFTTAGALVAAGVLVSGGIANPKETLGLPAFFVLGLAVLIAMAWAWTFRPRLGLVRQGSRLGVVGEPWTGQVTLTNHGRRTEGGLSYLEELPRPHVTRAAIARWIAGRGDGMPRVTPVAVPTLAPGASTTCTVQIKPAQRGVLRWPGGSVARPDPLGLFRAFGRIPAPASILVLPRRLPVPALALPGRGQVQPGGVPLAAGIGEAEEFAALRDYRQGDPLKRIHWRSSARTGELVVQEYHDEVVVRHALVLDTDETDVDLFEDAVSVAASFACTVQDHDSLLDLLFMADQAVHLTRGRGVGHAQPLLEALAAVQSHAGGFPALAGLVRSHAPRLATAILLVARYDEPRRRLVADLRAAGVPVVLLLLVPAGQRRDPSMEDPAERPDHLVLLEAGRLAEDLQALGGIR